MHFSVEKLRRLRERASYSRSQLARRAELSEVTLYKLETIQDNPTTDSLLALAQALSEKLEASQEALFFDLLDETKVESKL